MPSTQTLSRALGYFSLGLGAVQIAVPRRFSRTIGLTGDTRDLVISRLVGLRELTAAAGLLLSPRAAGWLWARAAGDALDLALLGAACTSRGTNKRRLAAATAAVLGVLAPDALGAWRLSKAPPASQQHTTTPPTATDRHATLTVKGTPEQLRQRWFDHARSSDLSGHVVGARFVAAPAGRGTEIHLTLREDSSGPLSAVTGRLATLRGRSPKQMAMDALRRFKQTVETGHIVRSESTLHGHPHPAVYPHARQPQTTQPASQRSAA